MFSFRAVGAFALLATAVSLRAQPMVPTVSQQIPAQSLVAGGTSASIDLRNYFTVPGVTGQVAQFNTVLGKFNVELLASAAPQSVTNFLAYVGDSSYSNTIIHRSLPLNGVSNRVIQGGGYNTEFAPIARKSPIPLEYNLANTRGTLAMARSTDPTSATSEWFFNIDDNTTALGSGNGGGYAVFARVLGTGMTVVDAISAVPTYTVDTLQNVPLRNIQSGQTTVTVDNEIVVNSVTAVPVYPTVASSASVITYSGNFTQGGGALVTGVVTGSKLSLTPLGSGNTTLTISATDTNGNAASAAISISMAASPVFTTQPASRTVDAGQPVSFSAAATAGTTPTFQWQLNGSAVGGVIGPDVATTLTIDNAQPTYAGLYAAVATSGVSSTCSPAILGISTTSKVIGTGQELQPVNIVHPNGNVFDQVLVTGEAETITADAGQVTRTSYIDPTDDIVQVEFSGAGTLSLVLDNPSGPATPLNYNQPTVSYVKGRAGIVISGANETTNVGVFSVGRATAFDPTGAYDILLAPSATNDPANNGSSLFVGHESTNYDGFADIAFIAITSTNGKFGGLRTSNVRYSATKGLTGIYAPGVEFTGPVFVGTIIASDAAMPVLFIGSCQDARITGGNLLQANDQPVRVAGLTQLKFTAGSDSKGNLAPAQINQGVLLQSGVNVGGQIVVYP